MTEIHAIDADAPNLMSLVTFRNSDHKHMVIAANKAASLAKGLREAVSLIQGTDPRDKAVVAWLSDLAGKFERCEAA